jgi:hypothetical protein
MLDSPETVEVVRGRLQEQWAGVEALARRLMADGTVSGRRARELLDRVTSFGPVVPAFPSPRQLT